MPAPLTADIGESMSEEMEGTIFSFSMYSIFFSERVVEQVTTWRNHSDGRHSFALGIGSILRVEW